jgi:thiol:disulfide interchange protein
MYFPAVASVLASLLLAGPVASVRGDAPPAQSGAPAGAKADTKADTKAAAKPAAKPVYDESADAAKAIDAALARAKKDHARVLIQWGANWCGWCRMLHATCASDATIAKKLKYEYEVVLVDIGRFDKHMDLAAKYGADLKKNGVPYLTVLDANGSVVANHETGSLEKPANAEPKGHDPAKVLAFLTEHQAPALKADEVVAAGLAEAAKDGKLVFLHFGAPWCGWCHKMEAWMAKPEVAAILAKAFVDVKVDTDRMTGGQALLEKHAGGKATGIPWFEFLGTDGKPRANSTAADGNIGFPSKPDEIAWFVDMLRSSGAKLGADDISALEKSLGEPTAK